MANSDFIDRRNRIVEMVLRTRREDDTYNFSEAVQLYTAEFPGEAVPARQTFVRYVETSRLSVHKFLYTYVLLVYIQFFCASLLNFYEKC